MARRERKERKFNKYLRETSFASEFLRLTRIVTGGRIVGSNFREKETKV
jgi:hypothetical protein